MPKKRMLDLFNIVDLECTCWKNKEEQPEDSNMDVIEIGITVVALDEITYIKNSSSIIVKPTSSKVSSFCTELTTLTQEDVDKGVSFREACDILIRDYKSNMVTWGSWGDFDRIHFERQCKREGAPYPFGRTHWNLKNLFAIKYGRRDEVGLKEALAYYNDMYDSDFEVFKGTLHRGVDDSHNIARLFIEMIK
jgi:inhibitor of KinA sporulation pathway (predicted exonuclease)